MLLGVDGNQAFPRVEARRVGARAEGLTAREHQVLELVAAGVPDEGIADRLGIAPSTVATLLLTSLRKLGAQTRVEAVAKLADTPNGELR